MDPNEIYAKTENGLRELRERKLNLPVTLRGLLILVDGEATIAEILLKAQSLQLDQRALTALERGGLIAKRYSAPSAGSSDDATPKNLDDVQRYLAAQPMMNDVISQHLGFRGYGLMLRLQRAGNLRDLHDLLPDVAKALIKRIGFDRAKAIVDDLERMITAAS